MKGITDILGSEKGLMALAVIVCATVLCGLKILGVQQWIDFAQTIFIAYVSGKTIQGVATGYYATKAPGNGPALSGAPGPDPGTTP